MCYMPFPVEHKTKFILFNVQSHSSGWKWLSLGKVHNFSKWMLYEQRYVQHCFPMLLCVYVCWVHCIYSSLWCMFWAIWFVFMYVLTNIKQSSATCLHSLWAVRTEMTNFPPMHHTWKGPSKYIHTFTKNTFSDTDTRICTGEHLTFGAVRRVWLLTLLTFAHKAHQSLFFDSRNKWYIRQLLYEYMHSTGNTYLLYRLGWKSSLKKRLFLK